MRVIMAKFPFFDHAKMLNRSEEEVVSYIEDAKEKGQFEKDIYFFADLSTDNI